MRTKYLGDAEIKTLRSRVRNDLSCEDIFKISDNLFNDINKNPNSKTRLQHCAKIFIFPTPGMHTRSQALILAT